MTQKRHDRRQRSGEDASEVVFQRCEGAKSRSDQGQSRDEAGTEGGRWAVKNEVSKHPHQQKKLS